ncbi:MAG: hypothetical protein UY31_C0006G0018 [Candidatus Wolfebacteria bacterium GW2011_GWE1_48_7]|uniref:Uncharacterized protein n=2 Tax=Candidatus Wolfeibacteriota TaxID=1752735 RepID=A0A0G1U653_9BACT|nr:MAG: hypothetical protein UX70_C0001G0040 [Candidatus Wolfebacteria bacterium GW2011_GWB1_47_1]KKU36410.1 MAG: hypothetical protein UX49_C0016G0003 [Candidatus Wolfebacteria bacterium GW2011_GWC2_46_275]KKU41723.1 MAG: hypothetical protein UX58_C0006G0032 [Candidatus Wolfebacteria bacterium GW2011_GWB2_46_69]KKU53983.1 MAG: hypothetical protein UX76_C0007G0042 [Candidatus Wolfebacteria bacterium GW2011_GWC1_47_103]KKU59015.1 MAG: hypothetical protein UX83_C0009G0031 [Candidatus Wolfebacteria
MKHILVIGAGGFIGSAITHRLLKEEDRRSLVFGTSRSGRFGHLRLDVTDATSVEDFSEWLMKNEINPSVIIYAAGNREPGGFKAEMKTSKRDTDPAVFMKNAEVYGLGLLHVATKLVPHMTDDGHIVVISSVDGTEKPPYYLSDRLYGASIAAQEVLVKWMRADTLFTTPRNIHVHRIAPGSVEGSPFYEGAATELLPQRMVPVSEIVEAVAQAINMSTGYVDLNLFASK